LLKDIGATKATLFGQRTKTLTLGLFKREQVLYEQPVVLILKHIWLGHNLLARSGSWQLTLIIRMVNTQAICPLIERNIPAKGAGIRRVEFNTWASALVFDVNVSI
jgi:hypothetical protein